MEDPQADHNRSIVFASGFVFLASLTMLCLFQSSALQTLAYDLPPNATTERVVGMAEGWHGQMEAFGTSDVTDAIGETIEELHEIPISEE